MNRPSRAGVAFLALGALMAAVVSWYNWEARAMSGILPYYEDYKRIILAGFDPAASRIGCPTFPMWGYGWVYVVTESKLAIVGFQQALGLLAAWMLVRHVERIGAPGHAGALGLLLLLSGPWFVLHSILWPYSIAASLTLMSVVLVHRGICLDEGGRLPVVLSGILFGLALNFRSDAFLMPLGLAFALWALGSPRGRAGRLALLWLACIYAMLVPWMAYTKHVSGHVLLTSTNGGANLFIGLGDLEGNKWGIVESDSDPLTHRILAEKLGPDYRMVSYDADQVLRREFLARVAEDPGEFARKCLRNLRLMWQLGAHPGEFEATAEPVTGMKGAVYSASCFMGLNVVRYSLLLLPFAAVLSCTRRRSFLVLVWLVVAYQTTLNMLGHYVPGYTNLVYVFHLLNVFLVVTCTLPQEEPAPRLEPPPSLPPGRETDGIELTILLPVRNEGPNLAIMLKVLKAVMEAKHEVVVVVDDPDDRSVPIVESVRSAYPECRLVVNDRGRGVLFALRAGVESARGSYVVIFAADEVGPVLALDDMLALAREGCDLVSCTRYAHGGRRLGGSFLGGLLSRLASRLFWLSGGAFTDSTTGIKLFRREVFEQLELDSSVGWSVAFQMAIKAQLAGMKLGEVPIISIDRLYGGESTFRIGSWAKHYLRLFLSGARRQRELRRVRPGDVRVRIPPGTPSARTNAIALLGVLLAFVGPWAIWEICLSLPSARFGNYLGLLGTGVLGLVLGLLPATRAQAGIWVVIAAFFRGPFVLVATLLPWGAGVLWRGRQWERG